MSNDVVCFSQRLTPKNDPRQRFETAFEAAKSMVKLRAQNSERAAATEKRSSMHSVNQSYWSGQYSYSDKRYSCYATKVHKIDEEYKSRLSLIAKNRIDALRRIEKMRLSFSSASNTAAADTAQQAIARLNEIYNTPLLTGFAVYSSQESLFDDIQPTPKPPKYYK